MPDVEFVVYPEGELDIATIPALREEWLSLSTTSSPTCWSSTSAR